MILCLINTSDHSLEVPLSDGVVVLLPLHDNRAAISVPWTYEQALVWGNRPDIFNLCGGFGVPLHPKLDVDAVMCNSSSELMVWFLVDSKAVEHMNNIMRAHSCSLEEH